MSKKLPFEDAFKKKMSELPTGNEDASWQKMKELLEKKDKRKPFAWINIYTVCSCIIIIAGLGIWMILFNSSNKQKNISKTENTLVSKKKMIDNKQTKSNEASKIKTEELNKTSTQKNNVDAISKQKSITISELNSTHSKHISVNGNKNVKSLHKQLSAQENSKDLTSTSKQNLINKYAISTDLDSLQNVNDNNQSIDKNNFATEKATSSSPSIEKNDSAKNATAVNNLKQPLNVDTTSIKKHTPISIKKKQFFIEAGLQLKQQIPLGGQKITAYNYSGDKGMLKDYIPSVFIKFEKDRQWFLQAEFGYATPNLVKQFSYSRQTKADYALSTVTITNTNLQKTYYNEMPLSFNYYVKPHWSIGTGVSYNWFRGAVTKQETTTNDIKNDTYTATQRIIPFKNFTDSFLYKNQLGLLFQTGYSLKRWSFILRYEKGIQPYIKYTLPDGTIESKKNSSIELDINYRLIKKPF